MNKKWKGFGAIVVACVVCTSALAQPPADLQQAGWVGLYSDDLLAILENENRLNELCPPSTTDAQALAGCRNEKLQEREQRLVLRSAPAENATVEGFIIVRAKPGAALRAFYQPADNAALQEFVPDLYDADWGYGPYFHQTFLEHQGDWFLLPAAPHRNAAWVYLQEEQLLPIEAGTIVTSPKGDLTILTVERDHLYVRAEQLADVWCEGGEPPPLQEGTGYKLPAKELYTPEGHLTIAVKYTRGC